MLASPSLNGYGSILPKRVPGLKARIIGRNKCCFAGSVNTKGLVFRIHWEFFEDKSKAVNKQGVRSDFQNPFLVFFDFNFSTEILKMGFENLT